MCPSEAAGRLCKRAQVHTVDYAADAQVLGAIQRPLEHRTRDERTLNVTIVEVEEEEEEEGGKESNQSYRRRDCNRNRSHNKDNNIDTNNNSYIRWNTDNICGIRGGGINWVSEKMGVE